jgi:hypothetical protein
VRATNEKDLALLRAKLTKAEINSKSQQETIDSKIKENEELMKICEQLIQKMDS